MKENYGYIPHRAHEDSLAARVALNYIEREEHDTRSMMPLVVLCSHTRRLDMTALCQK